MLEISSGKEDVVFHHLVQRLVDMVSEVLLPGAQMAALRQITFNEGQRGILPMRDRRMLEDEQKRDASL